MAVIWELDTGLKHGTQSLDWKAVPYPVLLTYPLQACGNLQGMHPTQSCYIFSSQDCCYATKQYLWAGFINR